MANTEDAPHFYDAEKGIEVFVDSDREIHVILPSEVYIDPSLAEKFAAGLLAVAKWLRETETG